MKIIDFHTHIYSPEVSAHREDYLKKDPFFAQLYSNPKARLASAEELIASMDEAGIAVSVAQGLNWLTHEDCVKSNDYVMEAVSRYPQRLAGFGMVLPSAGEAALRELERCIKGGIKGIGEVRPTELMFAGKQVETLDALAAMAAKNGLTLSTHSSEPLGHRYTGKGKVTPSLLYRLISKYPDLKVVCAHWGGGLPFYEMMPEVSQTLKNTCYDTAASSLLYRMDIFEYAAGFLPPGKTVFGTDFPLISQQKLVKKVAALNLPPDKEENLFSRNAERLLNAAPNPTPVPR